MLLSLSIRNIVLVESASLHFDRNLCALTGETGAGKSILLDALGGVLGERMDGNLLRPGAEEAEVTAVFAPPEGHRSEAILEEAGVTPCPELILRRKLSADGRSRAFANDRPITIGMLRRLGRTLVEIQGQFDDQGLADETTHIMLLDRFIGCEAERLTLGTLFAAWRTAQEELRDSLARRNQGEKEAERLRACVQELTALAAEPDEASSLVRERELLRNGEKIAESYACAGRLLRGEGAEPGSAQHAGATVEQARRALELITEWIGDEGSLALAALERAGAEIEDAGERIEKLQQALEHDPDRFRYIEERLFALRETARRLGCEPDQLAGRLAEASQSLNLIEDSGEAMERARAQAEQTRDSYLTSAQKLRERRLAGAKKLTAAIAGELPELRLDRAVFQLDHEELDEASWTAQGIDRFAFRIATLPGAKPGPIARIASGGERSRLLLALKAVLGAGGSATTFVFDEVDSGIGGATAAAVGRRLRGLAERRQLLVVTHSPQVAAAASQHWRVERIAGKGSDCATVCHLSPDQRSEEIARMLAGASITNEARAAAHRLLAERGDAGFQPAPERVGP